MEKLTEEEFKEFKQTYLDYEQAIFNLGNLEITQHSINEQLKIVENNKQVLLNKIKELNTKRDEINTKLGEKYGDKQVDLETGELK
jgi:uncharacterized coiled-coil DUF342 family protein